MSMTTSLRVFAVVCILLIGTTGGAPLVVAEEDPPGVPASYYGTVTVNGEPASPDGADWVIEAEIDGEVRGTAPVTDDGGYGGAPAPEPGEYLTVEGEAGDTVEFFLTGEGLDNRVQAEQTVPFEDGALEEVALDFEEVLVIEALSVSVGETALTTDETTTATVTAEYTDAAPAESATVTGDATIESEDTDVVTVDGATITPEGTGEATVTATYEGVTAPGVTVDVSPAPVPVTPTPDPDPDPAEQEPIEDPEAVEEVIDTPPDVEPTIAEVDEPTVDEAANESVADFEPEATPVTTVEIEGEVDDEVAVAELAEEPEATGPAPGESRSVIQAEVPPAAADRAATIEARVPLADVEQAPETLQVTRYNEATEQWESLPTTVAETTEEAVILEAETPGFSVFAVSEFTPPAAAVTVPETVTVGDDLTLDADETTAGTADIERFEWRIDGALLLGETGATVTTTIDDVGEAEIELTVVDEAGVTDTTTATVTVEDREPFTPAVTVTGPPDPVPAGTEFDVEVVVENTGEETGTETVTVVLETPEDTTTVTTTEIELAGGETTTITETITAPEAAEAVEVTATVGVAEDTTTVEIEPTDDGLPGFGVIAAVLALLSVAARYGRR